MVLCQSGVGMLVSAALSYFIVHDHSNIVNPRQPDL